MLILSYHKITLTIPLHCSGYLITKSVDLNINCFSLSNSSMICAFMRD